MSEEQQVKQEQEYEQQYEQQYGEEVAPGMNDGNNGSGLFSNNHDLIGVQGIIRSQKNEIEKKKVSVIALALTACSSS